MRLYIIGPVTGIKDDNLVEFERVKKELQEAGMAASIPHDFIVFEVTWEQAMRISICRMLDCFEAYNVTEDRNVVVNRYYGIALLDGWEDSKGATIEHDLAVALGIPCKPWREWLEVSNG